MGPRELISSAELWPLHTEGVMACVCEGVTGQGYVCHCVSACVYTCAMQDLQVFTTACTPAWRGLGGSQLTS